MPTAPSVATSLINVVTLPSHLPFCDYRSITRHEKSSIFFPQMLSSFHRDTCISACHSNSPSSCGLDDCKCTCGVTSCSLSLYLLQPLHFLPVGPRQPVVVLAVFFMTASITLTGEFVCLLLWLWWSLLYLLSTFHPLYQSSSAFSTAASRISWVYRLLQAQWERKWLTVRRLYIPFVCSFTPPRLQSW